MLNILQNLLTPWEMSNPSVFLIITLIIGVWSYFYRTIGKWFWSTVAILSTRYLTYQESRLTRKRLKQNLRQQRR